MFRVRFDVQIFELGAHLEFTTAYVGLRRA